MGFLNDSFIHPPLSAPFFGDLNSVFSPSTTSRNRAVDVTFITWRHPHPAKSWPFSPAACTPHTAIVSLSPVVQVCSCLATADPVVRAALFSRLSGSSPPAPSHPYSSSGGAATTSLAAAAVAFAAVPPAGDEGGSVGIPSSIGDSIISRTGEMGCQTTRGILDLLRWCMPRVLDLEGVSPAVTDSLLLR